MDDKDVMADARPRLAGSAVLNLIEDHEQRRRITVNLVASENLMSSAARVAMSSDLAHRYLLPPAAQRPEGIWDYPNQCAGRKIEQIAVRLATSLFEGKFADVRPLSGNNVAGILLASLVVPGDVVLTVPSSAGGHFATPALCSRFGLDRHDLPYDSRVGRIDIDQCARLAHDLRPKMIYLDASMILFPYPVSQLRQIFGPDCIIAYDASHCFGLIAGGAFQAPLREGADLLVGSTHKSMFGPQKGMIIARENGPLAARVRDAITPLFVSNAHIHHIAALAITLEELEVFGSSYARRVLENARTLGRCLSELGISVLFADQGYTDCHQLLCTLPAVEAANTMERLERCGIRVNGVNTPFVGGPGLRLGVAEVTRRGFREESIREVARCIADAVIGLRSEAHIARQIRDISLAHPNILFGFNGTGGNSATEH